MGVLPHQPQFFWDRDSQKTTCCWILHWSRFGIFIGSDELGHAGQKWFTIAANTRSSPTNHLPMSLLLLPPARSHTEVYPLIDVYFGRSQHTLHTAVPKSENPLQAAYSWPKIVSGAAGDEPFIWIKACAIVGVLGSLKMMIQKYAITTLIYSPPYFQAAVHYTWTFSKKFRVIE